MMLMIILATKDTKDSFEKILINNEYTFLLYYPYVIDGPVDPVRMQVIGGGVIAVALG
jgi:hypothetical protein